MDAINPTLAFAALFLGLSGHPREAPEDVQHQAAIVLPGDFGCADLAAVPLAEPVGVPLAMNPLAMNDDGLGFDLGRLEPVSALPDQSGSYNEAGCDTTVSQP